MSCPFECLNDNKGKQYDFSRFTKCSECPHREAEEKFKTDYEELITAIFENDKKFYDKHKKSYRFQKLYDVLILVMGFEDLPKDKLSLKNNTMLSVYLREKTRWDRIEDLEKDKNNAA